MKISVEEVRHVAKLARLELSPDEEEALAHDLGAILGHVQALGELATDDVPPTAHAAADVAAGRPDVVTSEPDVEALLGGAPDRSGDFFRVAKIIE